MASEEHEMKQRIAQLAGQINRHKNQSTPEAVPPFRQSSYPYPTNTRGAGAAWRGPHGAYSSRGRGYARGGKLVTGHRNRTLVLNNNNNNLATESDESVGSNPAPSWISKSDRHLQLINPAIFEKQSSERAKAMEETRKRKLQRRDERERIKLNRHLHRVKELGTSREPSTASASGHEIIVEGIRFRVVKGGSKLMKVPGDENAARSTPRTATVGGVTFYRSKNGNLYRSGVVKAQRSRGTAKRIDKPCQSFSLTGSCQRSFCRYNHDPNKVAICKDFLQKGSCPAGDACDLSHEPSPQRSPACLHFSRGNCSKPACPYSHVHVSPAAPVCRAFGSYGYCGLGSDCPERHVNECPDFSNTGACNTKKCKLPHRLKASIIRKNTADITAHTNDDGSDLSSDEDLDEIDSDDVDSDDMEFLGDDNAEIDSDIPLQQDYVQL